MIRKILRDIKREREAGNPMRPLWQMIYLMPLYPLYLLARGFVSWMDDQ